jgi:hypothetical protein
MTATQRSLDSRDIEVARHHKLAPESPPPSTPAAPRRAPMSESVTAETLTDEQIEAYGDAMMAEQNIGQWNLARSGVSWSPLASRSELFSAIRVKLAAAINARVKADEPACSCGRSGSSAGRHAASCPVYLHYFDPATETAINARREGSK